MPDPAPYFWAKVQIADSGRGYLRIGIPPDYTDDHKLKPGMMLKVWTEKVE